VNNIDIWDVITSPKPDIITKERTVIYLINIGIPHTCELGKCNFLEAKPSMNPHLHKDSFEICYHISGRQVYSVNGIDYETKGGDVFVVFPNEVHDSGGFPEDKSEFYYFAFNCVSSTKNFIGLDDEASDYIVNSLLTMKNRHFRGNFMIKSILEDIFNIYFSNSPIKKVLIQSLLIKYFQQIIACEKASHEKTHSIPKDIQTTLEYIGANPHINISIEELADIACLSVSRFKQKFKYHVGVPPYEYMVRKKIELSQDMLRYTDMLVTEIAVELNFSSSQHFSKVFKKFTCMTPGEYRMKFKNSRPK